MPGQPTANASHIYGTHKDISEHTLAIQPICERIFVDAHFTIDLGAVDRLCRVDEAVSLFSNIPRLWSETTVHERRKLIGPLIQQVYVDLELKQIAAIVPEPLF